MPRVPTYDSFQAAPNTLPQAHIVMPEIPDVASQEMQRMGHAMMAAGQGLGQAAIDTQQQANQLRIDDGTNRVKEAALRLTYDKDVGFTNLKGINALERPDGKPLADEYTDNLKNQIDDISSSLGNDAQRQAFLIRANDILTTMRGNAIQHEAQEFKTYALSTSESIQSTALQEIRLGYRNPDTVNSAIDRIRTETYRQGQLLGKSTEWQDAQARKLTSDAHALAITSALEQNDPAYADAYLKKYSGQMDMQHIISMGGQITKEMDVHVATDAVSDVMRDIQTRIQNSEAERAFNIALVTESGNRQFGADGKPLTSPKGAIGIAQVMPKTAPEAAKIAGLPWDENRYKTDAAYNKALGMAIFQKHLQDNGGNLAKAYAAYNAGPGRLASAVKKAEQAMKKDPSLSAVSWLDYMPQETKDYVAKNMKAFEAGQGEDQRPTFLEIDEKLRADPRLGNNPSRYKVAREEASRRFDEETKAIKQREEAHVAAAMRGIIENGGRYFNLPINLRAKLPPKEVDTLMSFAQKVAKGDDTTNLRLYNALTNNPEYLARMTEDQFFALRNELSQEDFKHFSIERAKLNGVATGSNNPGDLNSQAIKQWLDNRLRMMNIDPSPKDNGSSDAAHIGAVRLFVDQYFTAAQREAGKKFDDAQVSQHLERLFAKNIKFSGLFHTSSRPMLTMKADSIDSTTKDQIKAAYKREGIENPTDAQILNAFWHMKVTRK